MDLEPLKIDRSAQRSRRPRGGGGGRVLSVAVAVLSAGALWAFLGPLTRRLDAIRLRKVRTQRVERSDPAAVGAVRGLAANGYVVASRRAALSADTPGRIVELRVTEGSTVEKGEVVARLFDEEFAAALARAEAELDLAKANAGRTAPALRAAELEVERLIDQGRAAAAAKDSAEAEVLLSSRELERVREQRAQGVSTPRDLDLAQAAATRALAGRVQAEANYSAGVRATEAARANVEAAKHEVGAAQARVRGASAARELAAATLRKTEVRAPFRGVVVLKDAEVGEVVSPNVVGGGNARGSVATLVDFTSLEVQADLPETSLAGVQVGAAAQVFLDAYPSQPYTGRVSRIWPTANRQKATVEVRVTLDALDERLRPEMGVRVVFSPADGAEAAPVAAPDAEPPILIPEEALVRVDGVEGVFALERDVARFVPLRLGERRAGQALVLEGLSGGERIVLSPPIDLNGGDRVRLEE